MTASCSLLLVSLTRDNVDVGVDGRVQAQGEHAGVAVVGLVSRTHLGGM
jgi:hypothetical protein